MLLHEPGVCPYVRLQSSSVVTLCCRLLVNTRKRSRKSLFSVGYGWNHRFLLSHLSIFSLFFFLTHWLFVGISVIWICCIFLYRANMEITSNESGSQQQLPTTPLLRSGSALAFGHQLSRPNWWLLLVEHSPLSSGSHIAHIRPCTCTSTG